MTDVRRALLNLSGSYTFEGAKFNLLKHGALVLPATPIENLGNSQFLKTHGARFPYVAGAMANGIASVELVQAMVRRGFVGIYGAAGQNLETVSSAIDRLQAEFRPGPYGFNLIHSPNEPDLEDAVARMFIARQVGLVEASAYLQLTLPIVRYRVHGIHVDPAGNIIVPNRVIAKVSRVEVATPFLSPPPEAMLTKLIEDGSITAAQAVLVRKIPMCDDLTVEADSGGHTDNRPMLALFPTMLALRERIQSTNQYKVVPRIGAAGGIGSPAAASAAFAMGADYIVTGTINQACVESGSSDEVRQMLAAAGQADVAMAPAADMFEMGVKVQVLKRGTMFAMRAAKLYEIYQRYERLDDIPVAERTQLETQFFRKSFDEVWSDTKNFFAVRDPREVERGERDPRHKMALVFRSYLGQASGWANRGQSDRKFDFQVWCGPAIGAFNEWVKGSFLEQAPERRVANVAMNILYGAAVLNRAAILRYQGVDASYLTNNWQPKRDEELQQLLENGADPK